MELNDQIRVGENMIVTKTGDGKGLNFWVEGMEETLDKTDLIDLRYFIDELLGY